MRVLLQRVSSASVDIDGARVAEIGPGLLLLVGIGHGDTEAQAAWMARKIASLRVFYDAEGKMNLDVKQAGGAALSVSQFTLYGDTQKGNRPGFDGAAKPEPARALWEAFNERLRAEGLRVETGRFGADMKVALVNDGPVTFWIESPPAAEER